MRRLAFGLALVSVVGLVSCGESKPKKDAAVDSGGSAEVSSETGGDSGPAMCKGTFAFVNRTKLGAQANSAGKCASSSDLDAVCDNDPGGQVRSFGGPCFLNNPGATEMALAACILAGIKSDDIPDPSDGCLGCYLAVTGCTLAKCSTQCASNPAASICTTCQLMNNCLQPFYQCSGLPTPPGFPVPDGGAGDAAPGDGSASDATGDAPGDSAPAADAAPDADPDAGAASDTAADTAAG